MPEAKFSNEEIASNKGQGKEKAGSPTGPAGLYRHKQTGAELATKYDPLYGDVQSEALIRTGEWERVSDVPEGYVKELQAPSEEFEAQQGRKGASVGQVKGVEARLDLLEANTAAAEAENARLRELLAKAGVNPDETVPGAEETKSAAQEHVDSGSATGTEVEGTSTDSQKTDEKTKEAPKASGSEKK